MFILLTLDPLRQEGDIRSTPPAQPSGCRGYQPTFEEIEAWLARIGSDLQPPNQFGVLDYVRVALGGMLWLSEKMLSGSYSSFSATRRRNLSSP